MKKATKIIALFVIATLVFTSILLSNLFYWATNEEFYELEQLNNNVSKQAGLPQEKINLINQKIIDYLTLKTDNLQLQVVSNNQTIEVFSEKELKHMVDVRQLFIYGYIALGISLLILILVIVKIVRKGSIKHFKKVTIITPLVLLAISAIVIGIVLIDFNYWFTIFHKISFTNELWLLDPKTDILIQIMPLHFFSSMFTRIIITSMISLIAMTFIGFLTYTMLKRRDSV